MGNTHPHPVLPAPFWFFCLFVHCLSHGSHCALAVNEVAVGFWHSLCRKPKKEKPATKPTQGAELLKKKKKGFLPETKKRKNRKKGVQENGVAAGENGEPAAPEEQPLGAETPKHKKGLVPGGSKKHPNREGKENGVAKEGSGDLPTANGGDAVAEKKKKKKRKNRKRKGAAGSEAEQVPAAKKTKGSVVQETQQKQGKAKKKRKEKQAPVLQE